MMHIITLVDNKDVQSKCNINSEDKSDHCSLEVKGMQVGDVPTPPPPQGFFFVVLLDSY